MTDEQYMRIVSDPQYIRISNLRDENDRLRAENEALKAKLENGQWFDAVELAKLAMMSNTAKRLQTELDAAKRDEWISVKDRLPEEGQEVEIMERTEYKAKAIYEPKQNYWLPWKLTISPWTGADGIFHRRKERVTHWRGPCAENGGKDE